MDKNKTIVDFLMHMKQFKGHLKNTSISNNLKIDTSDELMFFLKNFNDLSGIEKESIDFLFKNAAFKKADNHK
jgi:hypothetical protein